MQMFRKKDEGFTLVELMVVVLIIGILVAIAIPVFNNARANAEKRSCLANQRTIEGAVQTYRASEPDNAMPANVAALAPTYIAVAPVCPTDKTTGYTFDAATGIVAACTVGTPAHGSHRTP